MSVFFVTLHVVSAVFLVLLVLVQSGKGAEISASFGGSSQTVFGSSGGANFFTKATSFFAAVFMLTSILLTIQGGQARKSVFEGVESSPASKSAPLIPPIAPESSVPASPADTPKK